MATYQCQNKGCVGEGFIELSDEEEDFYASKGLSEPKNCRTCKDWINQQKTDTAIKCEACGLKRSTKPQWRIYYHKKIGVWQDPNLCTLCEKDPERVAHERKRQLASEHRKMLTAQRRYQYFEHKREIANRLRSHSPRTSRYINPKTLSVISNPEKFDVLDNAEIYKQIPDHQYGNAYKHIIAGHHKSLKKLGTNDCQTLIFMGQEIAKETNSQRITQFEDMRPPHYTVKRDNITGQIAVIGDYSSPPPASRLITTYQVSDSQMMTKLEKGDWKPSI